jgi:hypothetical protein
LTVLGLTRTFLLLAPAAIPAGLGLAALAWAWRIYAITAGLGGWMASAPITFDARQWRRQARAARGRIAAPGAVPLLGSGGRIPVAARFARSGTAGTRSSPSRSPRARGTWSSSARPDRGRRT